MVLLLTRINADQMERPARLGETQFAIANTAPGQRAADNVNLNNREGSVNDAKSSSILLIGSSARRGPPSTRQTAREPLVRAVGANVPLSAICRGAHAGGRRGRDQRVSGWCGGVRSRRQLRPARGSHRA